MWRWSLSPDPVRTLTRLASPANRVPDRRCASSGGRTPEQLLDTAAFALGRTARAAIADSHRDSLLPWRRGRAVVDVALGGNSCADPFGDDPHDHHDALESPLAQPHLVTGPDRMRRLDPGPVDPDVPSPAGTRRHRAGLGQPHRPDPAVHPPRLITGHSATLMPFTRSITSRPLREQRRAPRAAMKFANAAAISPNDSRATRAGFPPPARLAADCRPAWLCS